MPLWDALPPAQCSDRPSKLCDYTSGYSLLSRRLREKEAVAALRQLFLVCWQNVFGNFWTSAQADLLLQYMPENTRNAMAPQMHKKVTTWGTQDLCQALLIAPIAKFLRGYEGSSQENASPAAGHRAGAGARASPAGVWSEPRRMTKPESNLKVVLCPYTAQQCPFEPAQCVYAHSEAERFLARNRCAHHMYKTKMCTHYTPQTLAANRGTPGPCYAGNECSFAHGAVELAQYNPEMLQAQTQFAVLLAAGLVSERQLQGSMGRAFMLAGRSVEYAVLSLLLVSGIVDSASTRGEHCHQTVYDCLWGITEEAYSCLYQFLRACPYVVAGPQPRLLVS